MDVLLLSAAFPLLSVLVVAVIGYAVIRRAVRDGILDARRLERQDPAAAAPPSWKRWQR